MKSSSHLNCKMPQAPRRRSGWLRWVDAATVGAAGVLALLVIQRLWPGGDAGYGEAVEFAASVDTLGKRANLLQAQSGRQLSRMDLLEIERAGLRVGPTDAPLVIIIWGDYGCSWCREYESALLRLRSRYPEHVAVIHVPLLLDEVVQTGLVDLHAGAYCARGQGRLEAYHEAAFAAAPEATKRDGWRGVAARIDMPDFARFERCVLGDTFRDTVMTLSRIGQGWGLNRTPTTLLGGRVLVGAVPGPILDSLAALALEGLRDPYL